LAFGHGAIFTPSPEIVLGKIEKNPQRLKLANASSRKFARPFLTRRPNIRASLREVTVLGGAA